MTTLAAVPRSIGLRLIAGSFAAAMFALLASCTSPSGKDETAGETPPAPIAKPVQYGLYELRVYAAADGKMDALNARVRDHEIPLFKKHGMTPIAFFMPVTPPDQPQDNRLFYIMAYKDRASRDAAWTAFAKDPEWAAAYKASNGDGVLTTSIATTLYTATDYSPVLSPIATHPARLFELRTYHATQGKLENVHARFRDHTLKIFARHGMTSMVYWRPVPGQAGMDDKMTYLLAFPSVETRNADWTAFANDPEWKNVSADSEKDGPILAQPGAVVSVQLQSTSYSPLK